MRTTSRVHLRMTGVLMLVVRTLTVLMLLMMTAMVVMMRVIMMRTTRTRMATESCTINDINEKRRHQCG